MNCITHGVNRTKKNNFRLLTLLSGYHLRAALIINRGMIWDFLLIFIAYLFFDISVILRRYKRFKYSKISSLRDIKFFGGVRFNSLIYRT